MKELIDVFNMERVSPETRARIIIRLGNLINDQYGSNITEGVVYELVALLEPDNEHLPDIKRRIV